MMVSILKSAFIFTMNELIFIHSQQQWILYFHKLLRLMAWSKLQNNLEIGSKTPFIHAKDLEIKLNMNIHSFLCQRSEQSCSMLYTMLYYWRGFPNVTFIICTEPVIQVHSIFFTSSLLQRHLSLLFLQLIRHKVWLLLIFAKLNFS